MASCQFSVYPLGKDDLSPAIKIVSEELERKGVTYESGNMSTVIYGSTEEVFSTLRDIFKALEKEPVVMVTTVSNACPIPKK